MKELYLKVFKMEKELPPGHDYMSSSYPHDGWFLATNGALYLRNNGCITLAGMTNAAMFVEINEKPTPVSSQVSVNDLLKVIAITRQPDLATGLCE